MVWVKYKEKYRGKISYMWKNKPSVASARAECRRWNQFKSPYEHLSIVRTSNKKPKNLRKTRYRGIYAQVRRR